MTDNFPAEGDFNLTKIFFRVLGNNQSESAGSRIFLTIMEATFQPFSLEQEVVT